jgi:hypothetical protein
MQTKRGEGNEREMTKLTRIVRSQQKFSGEKKQKQGAAMFGVTAPVLPYLGRARLKGRESKW